jgi:hypothetical protein
MEVSKWEWGEQAGLEEEAEKGEQSQNKLLLPTAKKSQILDL